MAIKGFSEDIVQALDFDPFAESGTDGGTDTRAPRANLPPAPEGDQSLAPGRDPASGKFVPGGKQPAGTSEAARANARNEGRDVSPDGVKPGQPREALRVPTGPAARPGEPEGSPQNTVQELMERVKNSGFAVPQTPVQQPSQGQPQRPNFPNYDYSKPWAEQKVNLPGELLDAIFHEDRAVAGQGMEVLVNTMYNALANEIHTRIAAVLHNVPQALENMTDLRVGQRALKDKFYGKFPELNTQEGQSTVYTIAQNISQLYTNMGQNVDPMSDDFIQYVGDEARKVLGIAPQPRPAPRRQFQTGGGTRDGGGSGGNPFMEAIGLA